MTFYSHKIASFVCLFYLVGGSSSRAADPTVAAKVISEAGAQQVLSAAEHEAEALHAPCAIAVLTTVYPVT
jgi:glc operon protein GlcG